MSGERSFNALVHTSGEASDSTASSGDLAGECGSPVGPRHPLRHPSARKTPARVESTSAPVAQLVEQSAFNRSVARSSRAGGTDEPTHSHAPRWLMVAAIVWALFAVGLTLDASIDKALGAGIDHRLVNPPASGPGAGLAESTRADPSVGEGHGIRRGTIAYCKRHAVDKAKRACIIRVVFAPIGMASKALRVAECESGLDPRARNGQFRGMFQVSRAWRRDVRGFGSLPEQQAWHARRVVTHPEGGWSHWECR